MLEEEFLYVSAVVGTHKIQKDFTFVLYKFSNVISGNELILTSLEEVQSHISSSSNFSFAN